MLRIAVLADAHAIVYGDQLRNDEQWSSDQRDNRMEYKKEETKERGRREGRERDKTCRAWNATLIVIALIVARDLIGAG